MYICIYIYICIHIFRWRMRSSKPHSHIVFVGEGAHLKDDISATAKEKGVEKLVEKEKKQCIEDRSHDMYSKGGEGTFGR